jgi:hypothetical protein
MVRTLSQNRWLLVLPLFGILLIVLGFRLRRGNAPDGQEPIPSM